LHHNEKRKGQYSFFSECVALHARTWAQLYFLKQKVSKFLNKKHFLFFFMGRFWKKSFATFPWAAQCLGEGSASFL
jgi:hypothetical protein